MIRLLICIFIGGGCLAACAFRQQKENILYLEADGQDAGRMSMGELVSEVKVYTFDTARDFRFGRIEKLAFTDSFCFIWDGRYTKTLYCFGREGKGEYKYQCIGRGPFEYRDIYDFVVDERRQEILLATLEKIIVLDFQFWPLREIKTPGRGYDRMAWQGDSLLLYAHYQGRLDWYDCLRDTLLPLREIPVLKNYIFEPSVPMFYPVSGVLYFLPPGSCCIYKVEGKKTALVKELDYAYKASAIRLYTNKRPDEIAGWEAIENPMLSVMHMGTYGGLPMMIYVCPVMWVYLEKGQKNLVLTDLSGTILFQQGNRLFAEASVVTPRLEEVYGDRMTYMSTIRSDNPVVIEYVLKE